MPELKYAAAYIRVSTEEQTELSPDSQLEEIRKYAKRENYILLEDCIFADEGISGKTVDKRPEFKHMIAVAKQADRPFDAILVWKFSRFARNQEESIFYKSILRSKCGVDVISITEPLIAGPFGSLIERIIEWMDEFYSIRLSQEVKRSMTVNAQRGVRQTAASFGYKLRPDKTMVPDEREAPLVRKIFDDFIAGKGLYPIAREFNAMGIKTHRGNKFENRTVEYILRNPVYIGKVRWNPAGRTRRDFDNPNIILADAAHEAIVTQRQWDAAQARMAEVKLKWGYKAKPTYNLKFWLGGIIRCAECGGTLVWQYGALVCNNHSRGRCQYSQRIKADVAEAAVIEKMERDAAGNDNLDINISYKQLNGVSQIDMTKKALEQIKTKQNRLKAAYLDGILDISEYGKTKRELDEEAAKLQAALDEASQIPDSAAIMTQLRQAISAAVEDIKSPDTTIEQKNVAAKSIIDGCTYSKADSRIVLTYRVII